MPQPEPFLNNPLSNSFARPSRPPVTRALAWGAVVVAFLNCAVLSCMCGHLSAYALPTNFIAVALTGYWAVTRVQLGLANSIVYDAAFVFAIYFTFDNLRDLLWVGHDPWLGPPDYRLFKKIGNFVTISGAAGLLVALVVAVATRTRQGPSPESEWAADAT